MKKLLAFVLAIGLVAGMAGCTDIEFENIHFGSNDEPEETADPVRCQLILDTRVVTVSGAYVYPAAVQFAYEIIIPGEIPAFHPKILKYTDSRGFVRYTTEVISVPSNAYVVIYVYASNNDEPNTIYSIETEMSYTYAEIHQENNRGLGTDLYTLAKTITVVKGSSGVAP